MLNKKWPFFPRFFVFSISCLAFFGCANRQLPQGGPRDLTPPKLLKSSPANMTRNFKSKEIVLEFDEFFKLSNQYQEISMSPTPEKLPEYNIRKKNL
jgi:hypothetical protein